MHAALPPIAALSTDGPGSGASTGFVAVLAKMYRQVALREHMQKIHGNAIHGGPASSPTGCMLHLGSVGHRTDCRLYTSDTQETLSL